MRRTVVLAGGAATLVTVALSLLGYRVQVQLVPVSGTASVKAVRQRSSVVSSSSSSSSNYSSIPSNEGQTDAAAATKRTSLGGPPTASPIGRPSSPPTTAPPPPTARPTGSPQQTAYFASVGGGEEGKNNWLLPPLPIDRSSILLKPDPSTSGGDRSVRFVNLDCHGGTAMDLGTMILTRGGSAAVQQRPAELHRLDARLRARWSAVRPLAPPFAGSVCPGSGGAPYEGEDYRRAVFQSYANRSFVREADAFLCGFPSALCEVLLSFNKTVIFAPGMRFSFFKCSKAAWSGAIRVLRRAARSTAPRHFVAAMSEYDAEYLRYFTGLTALPLYSSTQGYVPSTEEFAPTRPEILIGPLSLRLKDAAVRGLDRDYIAGLADRKGEYTFVCAGDLYGKFNLEQIRRHRAAVVFPYAVMSVGLTELYALGVPLFVPSEGLMRERPFLYPNDRTMTGANKTYEYCGASHGIVPPQHTDSDHSYSPEDLSDGAKSYWLRYADFYRWPHVQFFDSIDDLMEKLKRTDFAEIHRLMREEWRRRELELDRTWAYIASQMDDVPRQVPQEYLSMDNFLPPDERK